MQSVNRLQSLLMSLTAGLAYYKGTGGRQVGILRCIERTPCPSPWPWPCTP